METVKVTYVNPKTNKKTNLLVKVLSVTTKKFQLKHHWNYGFSFLSKCNCGCEDDKLKSSFYL